MCTYNNIYIYIYIYIYVSIYSCIICLIRFLWFHGDYIMGILIHGLYRAFVGLHWVKGVYIKFKELGKI